MPGFIALVLFVLVLVVGARTILELWHGAQARLEPGAPDPQRLDRVESALAELESRLAEIQEQQQFLERLLARRHEEDALPPGPRPGSAGEGEVEGEVEGGILFDMGREES